MHPHEKLLREVDEAQGRGDLEAFTAGFTDDTVTHVAGRSQFAGTYKGKDQFLELFGRLMEESPEYTFEPHAYLADDEHGVSLQRSHYKRGDATLDSNDILVYHFRDGKISESWFMAQDQDALDTFFA